MRLLSGHVVPVHLERYEERELELLLHSHINQTNLLTERCLHVA